jgi:hypothetical protein
LFRTLSPRGYQIGQCANLGKLRESIPDFNFAFVPNLHLFHQQVEKVPFLWGWYGVDYAPEI